MHRPNEKPSVCVLDADHSTAVNKTALRFGHDDAATRELELAALAIRRFIVEMGHRSRIRLHYGALMGMVELVVLLFFRWMRIDPARPDWSERDRFVLSKGHGAPSLYAALAERGYFGKENFANFRRLHGILQGHPDRNKTPGVDATTGSLGQGIGVACGMALAAKLDDSACKIYCLIGDGECNEGSVWEAALIAANLRLDRLIVLLDRNRKSSYGPMNGRNDVEPLAEKWRSFGWHVEETDGHDFFALSGALARAEASTGRPVVVICHTVKGKGVPFIENYPAKPNILLTDEQHHECSAALDSIEKKFTGVPRRSRPRRK